MISWTNLSLKHRLTLIGIVAASLPFPFVAVISHRSAPPPPAVVARPGLTPSDLDRFVDSAYQTVEFSQRELSRTLSVAGLLVSNDHGVRQLKSHPVTWPVLGASPVKLPPLSIRKTTLVPGSGNSHRPFVSEFSAASGTATSIFQRMNSAGDMLWIATSLTASPGHPVLGAVMPASTPAVSAVLQKKSYFGALATTAPKSVAGFEPITRADGVVIGMLAVSIPEADQLNQIREALSRIPVAYHARLFAETGSSPIAPGALEALAQDAKHRPSEIVENRYILPSAGEMLAHARYFAPYDWVVGVTVPRSEMAVPAPRLPIAPPDHTALALAGIFLVTAILSAAVCWRFSGAITLPVLAAQTKLSENVRRLFGIGGAVAQPLVPLREHEQIIELTSTALSQAGRNANLLSTGLGETVLSTQDFSTHAGKASAELAAMQSAMAELVASTSQVSGLVKEIGGIALQSRLLALNASIEAARAGHHGASFSVVADEFGKLAERCSENAKSTTALLTSSVTVSTSSTQHLARLAEEIGHFSRRTQSVAQSLEHLLDTANHHTRTLSELDRGLHRHAVEMSAAIDIGEKIRVEALSLEQNAEDIAVAVSGPPPAKRRAPKSPRSFAAKAPADIRSARRAC